MLFQNIPYDFEDEEEVDQTAEENKVKIKELS